MRLLWIISCVALICVPVSAQPLADRVPSDAAVYFGWKGTENLGSAYSGSHLKAVLDSSDLVNAWEKLRPQLLQKLAEQNPEQQQIAADVVSVLATLARHPSAFAFSGMNFDANQPMPKQALVCRAGTESASLLEKLGKLASQSDGAVQVGQVDDLVVVCMGYAKPADALTHGADAKGLVASAAFRSALAECDVAPVDCVFVDFQKVLAEVDTGLQKADEQVRGIWGKVKTSSGLADIKSLAATGAFAGKDWMRKSFLQLSGVPRGLLTVCPSEKIDGALLARVPRESSYVLYTTFDPEKLLVATRSIAAAADARAADMFDKAMGAVQIALGRNLQNDIFAPLGAQWVLYTAPSAGIGKNNVLGLIVANKLDDPAKAQKGLVGLTFALNNMLAGLARQQGMNLRVQQQKIGDVTELYFETGQPELTPAWMIKDGILYLGANRDTVAAAAKFQGVSFSENAAFNQLRDKLQPGAPCGFEFANLPETAPEFYKAIDEHGAALLKLLHDQGIEMEKLPLPPLQSLQKELSPLAAVSWHDDKGFHSRTVKPFPMSDALAAQKFSGGMTTVGGAALGAAVLLPSLNRARETANRVKCASNMRQIGQAVLLYANENKGAYPPDLGTLLRTQDLTWEVFVCPDTSTSLPKDVKELAAMATWTNEHSDYVYVGQKLRNDSPANKILLYESMKHHSDGCNILFNDGHCEFVDKATALNWIRAFERPAE
jgi:prepilin-type processing-associated H-X9-DG protein